MNKMDLDTRNKYISAVLGVVIIVLGYMLYVSITAPFEEVAIMQKERQEVRGQMVKVRDALVLHDRVVGRFPSTLDSLMIFLRTNNQISRAYEVDRVHILRGRDTVISQDRRIEFIMYSPRSNSPFQYSLNDTIRPQLYLLEDPDSQDHIGSLERTNLRNATSWN